MNRDPGFVVHICRNLGNLSDNIHTIDDLPEDNMLTIKVRAFFKSDKELAAIGVGPLISHR